jgi:hypothetical protein
MLKYSKKLVRRFFVFISIQMVVFAKKPFGSPKSVVEYLGRYTPKSPLATTELKALTGKCDFYKITE